MCPGRDRVLGKFSIVRKVEPSCKDVSHDGTTESLSSITPLARTTGVLSQQLRNVCVLGKGIGVGKWQLSF